MNMAPVWHDPIVEEIHATREHLASQFKNDLAAYSKSAEAHCRALGFQIGEDLRLQRNEAGSVAPVIRA